MHLLCTQLSHPICTFLKGNLDTRVYSRRLVINTIHHTLVKTARGGAVLGCKFVRREVFVLFFDMLLKIKEARFGLSIIFDYY